MNAKKNIVVAVAVTICLISAALVAGVSCCHHHREYDADLNGDSHVDVKDLALVCSAFGTTPDQHSDVAPYARYQEEWDFNGNGAIDIYDVTVVAGAFGSVVDC